MGLDHDAIRKAYPNVTLINDTGSIIKDASGNTVAVEQAKIDEARNNFKSVSIRAAILFFVLNDLSGVDPMYQFSLGNTLYVKKGCCTTPIKIYIALYHSIVVLSQIQYLSSSHN